MATERYDAIVLGAGIAGISTAYWLKKAGLRVALLDKGGLLAGASGAAGAFLSPRLGKGGALQKLTNDAYRFALNFYAKVAPRHIFQKGLVRLPKNEKDARRFELYEPFIDIPYESITSHDFSHIEERAKKWGGFFFPDAAFVDPEGVARELVEGVATFWGEEALPCQERGEWRVGKRVAPYLILATGAYHIPPLPHYIEIGGVWGERVDVATNASIPVTLHQKLSVSANVEGVVRIGATHVRNDPRSEIERVHQLMADAVALVPSLVDQKLLKIYAGQRASVNDHLPVVGGLAAWEVNRGRLKHPPRSIQSEDPSIAKIEGLYIVNGFGGRGFVFAPLMGRWLVDHIVEKKPIDPLVSPDRFLLRALRRQ